MKKALRKHIRTLKRGYTKEQLSAMSSDICSQLLFNSWVNDAEVVLAYYPLPDEVDVLPVIDALVKRGKPVVLPEVVSDSEMILREYHSAKDLKVGAFGILEPTGIIFTEYSRLDAALIPGMAFDSHGNRLGRGKGYYDRFLATIEEDCGTLPHLIGVCFPFQIVEQVPTDSFDHAVDEISCI